MNICIIGLPGCGKTTIGQQLSEALDLSFVDCDEAIEMKTGKSIPAIFEESGEDGFRVIETQVLKELFKEEQQIIALGGGIVLKKENRELLKGATVLFLDPAIDYTLTEEELATRPVMKEKSLAQLKRERQSLYEEVATITVHEFTMRETLQKAIEEIRRVCYTL